MAELAAEIRDFLSEAYDSVWVVGEVQRLHTSQRGHVYFELVEKGRGDRIVGKLDAVIWRSGVARIRRQLGRDRQSMQEGVEIRCRGRVDFYPEGGRLQMVIDEIDPLFTLGMLERRRQETLAALQEAGLLDRNSGLRLPHIPLRIGLVTSAESAAYHDFLSTLARSGYGFEVFFVHAAMQGPPSEREVPAALDLLNDLELDAVVLIRGGGARTDLQAFDSRPIALAVAQARWPVLTGLGHETDRTITDTVCHTALGTPSKAAEFLVGQVVEAEDTLRGFREELGHLAGERLRRAAVELGRAERLPQIAGLKLAAARQDVEQRAATLGRLSQRRLSETERRLSEIGERLSQGAPLRIRQHADEPQRLAQSIANAANARLATRRAILDGMARLCHELAPRRTLERGFSITRTVDGVILRDPEELRPGQQVESELAGGKVLSTVSESEREKR